MWFLLLSEGGVGLKRLEGWNKSDILRHIWNLFVKGGSLWVAWVREYLLSGKSFWLVNIPHSCSWSWRKLLKLRDVAKKFLQFKIGDGQSVHLWLDNWHPDGILFEKYGFRAEYDAGSNLEAKVSSVLKEHSWC